MRNRPPVEIGLWRLALTAILFLVLMIIGTLLVKPENGAWVAIGAAMASLGFFITAIHDPFE